MLADCRYKVDFFVFFANPNASGIKITTPASKNTVVPTTSPVIPSAIPAFFSLNVFTIDEKTTLKSWTMMETIIGLTGLICAIVISLFA